MHKNLHKIAPTSDLELTFTTTEKNTKKLKQSMIMIQICQKIII